MDREKACSNSAHLGGLLAGQLTRLCAVAELGTADAEGYAELLTDSLGPVAQRPLALPPPSRSFLSDDHTPAEFSLAFRSGSAPALRVLLEPGCGGRDLAENGRTGLRVIREMADRWQFSTDQLDRLEDLFFPAAPEGALALWCALELRPGGVPAVKVYLDPAANGRDRTAETVREALARLGHRKAFDALPQADAVPFIALDLGEWEAPRVKVYLTHYGVSAGEAGVLSRRASACDRDQMTEFFRTAGDRTAEQDAERPFRSRVITCHSFTQAATGLPTGYTLHVPVREHVRDDWQARERAVAVLRRHGMDSAALDRALAAVTPRRLTDGPGLIAYVALVHQRGHAPRVTVYVSAEAYDVPPPREAVASGTGHAAGS